MTSSGAEYMLGDLNDDGKINTRDMLYLRLTLAGQSVQINTHGADINMDGSINALDMKQLRLHLIRKYTIKQRSSAYPIAALSFNGVNVENYRIVIPENADTFTTHAAEILTDYFSDYADVQLETVTDAAPETQYEILIGTTNRSESVSAASAVTLAAGQYLLKLDGAKIVMLGNTYMIGGAIGKLTYDYVNVASSAQKEIINLRNLPTDNTVLSYVPKDNVNNVILMIGDGMGSNHIALALKWYAAKYPAEKFTTFAGSLLPNQGACTTRSLTAGATDSAAAGTALATGFKTYNYRVGVGPQMQVLTNVRELAASQGRKTAVMTTETIAGATPAAFTVHTEARSNLDLILQLQQNINIDYLKGSLEEQLLPETKKALDIVFDGDAGSFSMIEEAYTDVYSHYNLREEMCHVVHRLSTAVEYAEVMAAANPDTVLIITADHETGGISGNYFTTTDHTTANVPVFAMGKGTEIFNGTTVDNIDIAKFIARCYGVNNFGQ